ncbi:DUF2971 domain-containing protein [Cellulomonas sp. P5_E12]
MTLFGDLDFGEAYFYHYTRAERLRQILDGGRLRMGPYASTNDPRETKAWYPSLSVPDDEADLAQDEHMRLMADLDGRLRGRAKVLCLTRDAEPRDELDAIFQFRRGYARARMWDQYGDRHAGACLVFDRRRLHSTIVEVSAPAVPRFGNVRYENRPVGPTGRFNFDLAALRRNGVEAEADTFLREHTRELFFHKNTDWESEQEFRYVVVDDRPELFVPIWSSLVAVVLGDAHDADQLPAIRRHTAVAQSDIAVAVCRWQNGAPNPLPAG